jgi:hypothetical protein
MKNLVVIIGQFGQIGSFSVTRFPVQGRKLVKVARDCGYRESLATIPGGTIRIFRTLGVEAKIEASYEHVVDWIIGPVLRASRRFTIDPVVTAHPSNSF